MQKIHTNLKSALQLFMYSNATHKFKNYSKGGKIQYKVMYMWINQKTTSKSRDKCSKHQ